MYSNQTLETLRQLKLTGMADGLEQQLSQPSTHAELSFEERLGLLVDRESTQRNNNKVSRLLKAAKLKLQALAEDGERRATLASRIPAPDPSPAAHVEELARIYAAVGGEERRAPAPVSSERRTRFLGMQRESLSAALRDQGGRRGPM